MPAPKSVAPATWDLPVAIRRRLGQRVGRQRAMTDDGHLLLVLHAPPREGDDERQPRLFWRKPDGAWQSNDLGTGAGALSRHLQEFADLLDQAERDLEQARGVEEQLRGVFRLSPLQRTLRNLHGALQEARQALPDDADLLNARDRAYELERTADLLHHDLQNHVQLRLARQSEEQSAAAHRLAVQAHRLNILVALFLPLAAATAVFGMNLDSGLTRLLPEGTLFGLVVGGGMLLGLALALYFGVTLERDERR